MQLGLLTLGDYRADPATGVRTTQQVKHQQLLDYIDFAAPAGFDTVIVGEHHFSEWPLVQRSLERSQAEEGHILEVPVRLSS